MGTPHTEPCCTGISATSGEAEASFAVPSNTPAAAAVVRKAIARRLRSARAPAFGVIFMWALLFNGLESAVTSHYGTKGSNSSPGVNPPRVHTLDGTPSDAAQLIRAASPPSSRPDPPDPPHRPAAGAHGSGALDQATATAASGPREPAELCRFVRHHAPARALPLRPVLARLEDPD
jgi:hypothetical protein